MRKLDRELANKPKCLVKHENRLNKFMQMNTNAASVSGGNNKKKKLWDKVSREEKDLIWQELNKFQNRLCVYCEDNAYRVETDGSKDTGHIEHFFARGGYIQKTFEWSNLFGSCESHEHCGHFKKNKDAQLLIKPDIDDPAAFLEFLDTGKVMAKGDISTDDQQRADETIKVLYLNEPSLVENRISVIEKVNEYVNALFDEQLDFDLLKEELEAYKQTVVAGRFGTAVNQAVDWVI